MEQAGVALFVVSMMVTVGLDLTWRDVLDAWRRPRAIGLAMVANYALLPAVAWLIVRAVGLPAPVAAGVLLIAAVLGEEELVSMVGECKDLNIEPLVEVHTAQELEWALRSGTRIVGINNRNLSTFEVSLDTTRTLAPLVPPDRVVVCESGIRSREEIKGIMEETGVQAFLVGETLSRARDPVGMLEELRGVV